MMDHNTAKTDNRRLLRRAFLMALIPAAVLAGRMAESAETTADWTIDIQPNQQTVQLALQETPAVPAAEETQFVQAPAAAAGDWQIDIVPNAKVAPQGITYWQAYNSIPFIRSVYLANPGYRHDAAMELMTGVPRQSVQATWQSKLNEPIPPQPQFLYNNWGGYGGGYGPAAPFGYGFNRAIYPPAFRYFLPLEYGF